MLGMGRDRTRREVPWVYLSTVTFFLAGTVFYLSLARLLPADEVGSVVILLAIASLFSAVFSLGLGPGFLHFLSFYLGRGDHPTLRVLIRSALVAAGVMGLAAGVTTLGLSPILAQLLFHDGGMAPLVRLVAAYAALLTTLTILQSVLLGLQRFIAYSVLSLVTYSCSYGIPLGLLLLTPDPHAVALGWAAGTALGCALFLVVIVGYYRRVDPGEAPGPLHTRRWLYRAVLTYSLPLFVSSTITTGAIYVDRLILASLASLATVGVYNYAILVGAGSLIVVAPFSTILVPKFSEYFGRGDFRAIRGVARAAITLIVLAYVPFALAVAAIAPLLLRLLVGSDFVGASRPLEVLLLLTSAAVPASVLTSIAAGIRRTTALMAASGVAILTNGGLSFALVPTLGMEGAAIGNSAMTWAVLVVLSLALRKSGVLSADLGSIARIWASAGAMFVVVAVPLYVLGYPILLVPVLLVAGLGVLLAALRVSRAVSREVSDLFLDVIPRWLRVVAPIVRWLAPGDPTGSTERA
jgi:O-antigen/teichoic acid export membrane protein